MRTSLLVLGIFLAVVAGMMDDWLKYHITIEGFNNLIINLPVFALNEFKFENESDIARLRLNKAFDFNLAIENE